MVARPADPAFVAIHHRPFVAKGYTKDGRISVNIRFAKPMFKRIQAEASKRGISFSAVVLEMLQAAEGLSGE